MAFERRVRQLNNLEHVCRRTQKYLQKNAKEEHENMLMLCKERGIPICNPWTTVVHSLFSLPTLNISCAKEKKSSVGYADDNTLLATSQQFSDRSILPKKLVAIKLYDRKSKQMHFINLRMSIRAKIIQKELSNVSLQKDLGVLVNSNLKRNDKKMQNVPLSVVTNSSEPFKIFSDYRKTERLKSLCSSNSGLWTSSYKLHKIK